MKKIFLAKKELIYYSVLRREFTISTLIKRTLLIFSLISIAFPSFLQAELELKDKMAEEYRMKGYEAQKKGDLDKALTFYIKAAGIGDDSAPVYNDIGVIYEQLGMEDEAESNYLEAIKLDKSYLPAYSNLAYFYKNRGDLRKAADYFMKRLQLGAPNDPWTHKAREELYELGNRLPQLKRWIIQQEAMKLDRELTQSFQQEFYRKISLSQEYFREGQMLRKKGKYREALAAYNQALSLTPDNPKVIKARDHVLLKMIQEDVHARSEDAKKMLEVGDTVSAKMEFRKILSIIPNEPILISE